MTPEISVAVLAYNEEENIVPVLDEVHHGLSSAALSFELLVVDDGSSDDTAARAERAGYRVIRRRRNGGMGAGLKSAARAAKGRWLTFLPADGQVPPSAVEVLHRAASEDVDLVLSVYEHRDDGAVRTLLSWGVRALIRGVHGVRLQSEGPYLIRRRLFDPDQLEADTFFLNFEVPIRALRAGLRTRVVEVRCLPRRAGVSKTARPGRALAVGRELVALRARFLQDTLRRALGV